MRLLAILGDLSVNSLIVVCVVYTSVMVTYNNETVTDTNNLCADMIDYIGESEEPRVPEAFIPRQEGVEL